MTAYILEEKTNFLVAVNGAQAPMAAGDKFNLVHSGDDFFLVRKIDGEKSSGLYVVSKEKFSRCLKMEELNENHKS